jgi:HEAT repeat protein
MLVLEQESNPAIQATAIAALAKFHGEPTQSKLIELLDSKSFNDELALAAISAMGRQNDPVYAAPLMKMLRERGADLRSGGMARLIGTVAKLCQDTDKQSECFDYIKTQLNHPKTNVRAAMIAALGELGDRRGVAILESHADSSNETIKRAAERAINNLNEKSPAAPAEVTELRKSLGDLRKETEKIKEEFKAFQKQTEAAAAESNDAAKAN